MISEPNASARFVGQAGISMPRPRIKDTPMKSHVRQSVRGSLTSVGIVLAVGLLLLWILHAGLGL
jgi:hypothetical protein